jgi:hypothetical protein
LNDYTTEQLVQHTLTGLPDDLLEHRRRDLVSRCRAVQAHGWDLYRYTWSSGEAAAVAYLLNSADVLKDMSETSDSVLRTWAYTLWGRRGGQADTTAGFPRTRQWFEEARTDFESGIPTSTAESMSNVEDSSRKETNIDIHVRIVAALSKQAARDGLGLQLPQILRLATSVIAELQLQKYWGVIGDETLLGVYPDVSTAVQGLGTAQGEGSYEAVELRTHYASAFEPLNGDDAALSQALLNPANDVPDDPREEH